MQSIIESMLEFAFGSDLFDGMVSILTKSPSAFPNAWAFVTAAYNNVMLPIGYGIMVIYFLIALLDKASSEQFSLEQALKLFIKLLVVKIVLDNGLDIMNEIMRLGNLLVSGFVSGDSISASTNAYTTMLNLAKQETNNFNSVLASIVFMFKLIIPYIGSFLIQIVMKFVCYSRIIEIMIRTIIAPVAIGDMFSEGMHGSGFRFLKSYLAVCLQGMIIFCIAFLFSLISADVLTGAGIQNMNFLEYSTMYLTMGFACVALITKSLSLAKELVGTA